MGTTTTTFALNKPTVGGDDNAWGTDLNANADKLDDLLDGTTAIKPNLDAGLWKVGGVAVTSTAAELNILDGVTASTAELNILDGVTATTAELNILDGVTASAAELNILDGATLTVTELNYVDGVTSAIQTQLDAKYDSGDLASQAEAEAGTDNTKVMTPLRSSQAIAALGGAATLLGTLTTTSGSTQTLSGLVLTPFRSLWISFQGVSGTATSTLLRFASPTITVSNLGATAPLNGFIQLDLKSSGTFCSVTFRSSFTGSEPVSTLSSADMYLGRTDYSTATTSIGFSVAAGAFDAGSISFYGVK